MGSCSSFRPLEEVQELRQGFVLRHPSINVDVDRDQALANLTPHFVECIGALGFDSGSVAAAEQVHGGDIAVVEQPRGLNSPLPGVDGILTFSPGILLGIYVADCCAVYIADRQARAIALVHSGKKGTEEGIAPRAIGMMAERGIAPEDLIVQLSPCIRPPAYEVDFAAQIRSDCAQAGVPLPQIHDDGACTSRDLERYYSYRVEKGRTGRMLALLGLSGAVT